MSFPGSSGSSRKMPNLRELFERFGRFAAVVAVSVAAVFGSRWIALSPVVLSVATFTQASIIVGALRKKDWKVPLFVLIMILASEYLLSPRSWQNILVVVLGKVVFSLSVLLVELKKVPKVETDVVVHMLVPAAVATAVHALFLTQTIDCSLTRAMVSIHALKYITLYTGPLGLIFMFYSLSGISLWGLRGEKLTDFPVVFGKGLILIFVTTLVYLFFYALELRELTAAITTIQQNCIEAINLTDIARNLSQEMCMSITLPDGKVERELIGRN